MSAERIVQSPDIIFGQLLLSAKKQEQEAKNHQESPPMKDGGAESNLIRDV